MSSRLGSAQLELARYGNELARLGSLSGRAESQARLGSFGSSSWLVWLTSQLKKKPSQLALAEPDASMAAGWWRNKKMSRVFLHGCGERGPAAGGAFVAPSRSSGGRGRRGAGPRPRGAPRAGAPAARPQGRAPAPGGGSLEGRAGLPGTTGRARRRGEVGGGDGTRESPSRRAEVGVGVWDWESRRGRLRVSLSSSRSWAAGPARFERWLASGSRAARELARAGSIRDRAKTLAWLIYIFLRAEPSRATNEPSRASYRATSFSSSLTHSS